MSRRLAYIDPVSCNLIVRDPASVPFSCAEGIAVTVDDSDSTVSPPSGTSLLGVAWGGFGANDEILAFNRITGAPALNNPVVAEVDPLHGCDVDPATAPSYVYYTSFEVGNNSFLNRRVIDKSSAAESNLVNITNGQGAPAEEIAVDKTQQLVWIAKIAHLVRVPIGAPWTQSSVITFVNTFDNNLVLAPDELGARLFYGREESDIDSGPAIYRINASSPFADTLIASLATIDLIPGITTGSELHGLVYVPKSLSLLGKNYLFALNQAGDCFRIDEAGTGGIVIVQDGSWDDLGVGSQSRLGLWSCIRYHEQENKLWLLAGRAGTTKRMFVMNLDGTAQEIRITKTAPSDTYRGFGFGSQIVS